MESGERSEKFVLAGLIAFGVIAIVLGMGNLQRFLRGDRPRVASTQHAIPSPEDVEAQSRIALAAADTDGDGLHDLDELERTLTSPFLADSDSDGKTDKEEIDAGEDPNCPEGETCFTAPTKETDTPPRADGPPATRQPQRVFELPATSVPSDLGSIFSRVLPGGGVPSAGSGAQPGALNFDDLLRQLPTAPADIRAFLIQGGTSRAYIDQLDDAALMEFWQETIATFRTTPSP